MADLNQHVADWLNNNALSAQQVDCVIAVMLKILDGKCKMPADEKQLMSELYQQIKTRQGDLLGQSIHELIAQVGTDPDESMRLQIYEQRVLAETRIARPKMKAFKAMIRETRLL